MSKNELMKKIQALSFALLETNLFLDTHVNNKEALDYYYDIKDKLGRLTEECEENYGPITASGTVSDGEWSWVLEEWPWQSGAED